MLRQLVIENYGLIERAEIEFSENATVFTGETGSGKTMLLGALGFVLGDRATADVVRPGTARANVTLTFTPSAVLRSRLSADGYTVDEGEDAIVARDISANGKTNLRLNGRPTTASYVRDISGEIADIVGQHDAQRLLSPAYHLDLLDRFSGNATVAARDRVRTLYEQLRDIEERLSALEGDERRVRALYEDGRYAIEEIDAANIQSGEDERLTERRRFLDNIERIAQAMRAAHDALSGEDGSTERSGASAALGSAVSALHGIALISPRLGNLSDRVLAVQEETNDLAAQIARELEATEFDPGELEEINSRLEVLDRLKRKYGQTLEEVAAHAEKCRRIVTDFEGRDERSGEFRKQHASVRSELVEAANALRDLRHAAAKKLVKAIAAEFSDLALASGRFDAQFEPLDAIGPTGNERLEFTFAANAGQPLRPLARVASGGELSRVLLALVMNLQHAGAAFVFDEIDTGIGGATATAVGVRLGRLAESNQVACVTHLAQIAGWAKAHYVLEKSEKKNVTAIGVRRLATVKEREAELARMLSGETHDAALKHARTLLRRVQA